MDFLLLAKSIALGLAVAAPLGPIGTLCINRTLKRGFRAGFAGGVGTAMGDACYAGIAALGLSAFAAAVAAWQIPLKLGGGALMLWLGWRGIFGEAHGANAAGHHQPPGSRALSGTVLVTFLMTITNPMTIFFFAAVFASLGTVEGGNAVVVVAGIFCGSLLWWGILCGGVAMARHRLSRKLVRWISRAAGAVLVLIGVWALGSACWEMGNYAYSKR